MAEHTIITIILAVASGLLGLIWWFIKRDRRAIDADLTALRDELRADMAVAMKRIDGVEHNYVERLDGIKDSVSDLKVSIAGMFGDLKATLAREYMSKDEAERAYNHIRTMSAPADSKRRR